MRCAMTCLRDQPPDSRGMVLSDALMARSLGSAESTTDSNFSLSSFIGLLRCGTATAVMPHLPFQSDSCLQAIHIPKLTVHGIHRLSGPDPNVSQLNSGSLRSRS